MEFNILGLDRDSLDGEKTPEEAPQRVSCVPGRTCLYRHFGREGELLYVGISLSPTYRLSQHRIGSPWFEQIANITVEWFETRQEALDAERAAIIAEQPMFNTVHKRRQPDDLSDLAQQSADDLTVRFVRYRPSYTVDEAAKATNIKASALRRAMAAGDLRYYKGGTSRPLISGWSLIEYMEALESGRVSIRPAVVVDGVPEKLPTLTDLADRL